MRRTRVPEGTPGATPFAPTTNVETGPSGGFTPNDLLKAYGLDNLPTNAGAGQVVAAVDAYNYPNALSDLQAFDAQYGLPAETADTFQVLNQNGATSPLPANNAGWAIEESLDIQAIRAICHQCKILLVETNSNSFNDLAAGVAAAAHAGATEISNSYGGPEGTTAMSTGTKNLLTGWYNWPGVVVTASTGDDGWYGYDMPFAKGLSTENSPSFPATLPNVVAVGGTSLVLNSDATRNTEAVWNENGPETKQYKDLKASHNFKIVGATGGGCSLQFTANSWQTNTSGWANTGCGTSRMAADVSALADPYTGFDVYNTFSGGGWGTYGGTSLASPLIAAMWALAGGAQGVANPALTLYGQAKSGAGAFYDVTKGYERYGTSLAPVILPVGGNDWCSGDPAAACKTGTAALYDGETIPNTAGGGNVSCVVDSAGVAITAVNQCTAAVGFDGPSGLGTPKGLAAFTPMTPSPSFSAPTGVVPGAVTNFGGSATDPFPGGSITSYSWHWGDGTTDSTGASASHTFASAGTYTVKLTATDNYGQVGSETHDITVGTLPPPNVAGVSPSAGPKAGGTSVTITGTNFTGATAVKFGFAGPTASFHVDSPTQITATSPAASKTGYVNVTVTTPNGTSAAVTADRFTYKLLPTVTAVTPNHGPTTGGTSVVITGTGFTGASAVKFGFAGPATFHVDSPTQITATSPAASKTGYVNVTVTTPNGTSAAVTADRFTYRAT
jgi:PKD repeat protein